jgi:integral membrane protein (TIGR00529 family)
MVAPFIIGLLPSAGAVLIASPIVDNAGGEYISREDKTFIASFYRHIPESFLPVYSSILLALNLSKVDMTAFVLGMLPLVVLLYFLGYIFYVRKIPKETGLPESEDKGRDVKNLIISLWPVAFSITIILILKIPVYIAILPVILLSIIINKFTLKEIMPMFVTAIEVKLILSTVVIMMFKDLLTYTGVIGRLPAQLQTLPVPATVIFAFIFFFGTLIAGATAMTALSLPLAFAAIPTGGVALLILLLSLSYISMQISPTHICLAIVTEEFKTSMFDLVKRTLPILVIFTIVSSIYSYILFLFNF